jgi:chitinase
MTPTRTRAVKTRRLSPWRVLIAVSAVAIGIALALLGWRELRVDPAVLSNKPWFAPYVDVTATPQFNFEQLGANTYKDAVLAFIVASPNDGCEPTWGGEYTLDQASSLLDLDRRIARLKQQGGTVAVSFGGLANNELATTCRDESKLLSAYRTVVERYDLTTIDIDLENEALTDPVANTRRAKVISSLQKERREANKPFAVWATIPVTPQGLNEDGTNAASALLKNSVDLAGVNIMTMNYNSANTADQSTADIAIDAITHTKRQISVLYEQAGIHLNDATLWRKIGITPMIGQTDVKREVFTIADAKKLNRFAIDNHAGRMSMWSANRDAQCGSNYVDVKIVSDSCSGVKQERFAYMLALGNGFIGTIAGSAVNVTVSESKQSVADNPDTSPYPLWVESAAYLQGSKIVWQGNVYEAKWWTRGDQPDNPVLQSWETPWKLVGPVLPGEKRIEQPKLPDDTYVQWSGDDTYETGQRVLFEGTPYEAKWWTRGDSPAAASSDPSSSPWVALAQSEINDILKNSE